MKQCTETGQIYASIHCGFLSYMLLLLPCTYLLIISSTTLRPFHSCLNEPPHSFCLRTQLIPYHLLPQQPAKQ
ncbi:hypothetical protein Y032_0002g890 [Ancylostoma ceylanicum]|uniref:Uncharacterized protein n=1 Tax=Ancylostoma ceylanicum TaxID=53326 RepID=A0A016W2W0_9BILA|nr:hypothetical protein Y032_0002g890 [Ancylostoma ceylanicum]